jgi:hypothetical protein
VQVCKEAEKEMIANHTTPLDVRSKKIATSQNQFVVATNMKHDNEGGKNSEVQTPKLKGNQNNSDLNLRGKLLSNHDETSAAISIELVNLCPDTIRTQVNSKAEIFKLITFVLVCITLILF